MMKTAKTTTLILAILFTATTLCYGSAPDCLRRVRGVERQRRNIDWRTMDNRGLAEFISETQRGYIKRVKEQIQRASQHCIAEQVGKCVEAAKRANLLCERMIQLFSSYGALAINAHLEDDSARPQGWKHMFCRHVLSINIAGVRAPLLEIIADSQFMEGAEIRALLEKADTLLDAIHKELNAILVLAHEGVLDGADDIWKYNSPDTNSIWNNLAHHGIDTSQYASAFEPLPAGAEDMSL